MPPTEPKYFETARTARRFAPPRARLLDLLAALVRASADERSDLSASGLSEYSSTVAIVPEEDLMISAQGLRKSFGDFEAVRGIDVAVRRGEAFGFLGPNGAGKSSTMRMIAAVSPVSGGELRILGRDPAADGPAIRGRLGVCPQDDALDTELSVFDNLFVYGRYFGIPASDVRERARELLEFVQMTEKATAKVEELSGGMKRRLTIARSLINRPDLLLLDEPTTGLDPQARHLLWDKLFRLKQTGVTLVITTHYMDEAEQLCDRLVVMDKGVIVAEGSPAALIAEHSTREVTELRFGLTEEWASEDDDHAVLADKVADLGERVEVLPDRLLVYSPDGDEVAAKVHERGLRPVAVLVRRSTLEDVFLHLTGRTLVD
jgi:lipooligosaccharide transport system ATP-binding protein